MKKKGVFDFIKKGILGLYNNPLILLPAVMVPFSLWIGIFLGGFIYISTFSLALKISLSILLLLVIAFLMFFFSLGTTGMAKDIAEKKKLKINALRLYWNKFWKRYIGVSLLILIIFGLIMIAAGGLGTLAQPLGEPYSTAILGLLIVIGLLISILFTLPPYILLLENKTVLKSLRKGILVAKKSYFELF